MYTLVLSTGKEINNITDEERSALLSGMSKGARGMPAAFAGKRHWINFDHIVYLAEQGA